MRKHSPDAIAKITPNSQSNVIRAALPYMLFSITILLLGILLAAQVLAKPAPQEKAEPRPTRVDQPVELGEVRWLRDLDTAVSSSKKQDKPIAILFQEVPG